MKESIKPIDFKYCPRCGFEACRKAMKGNNKGWYVCHECNYVFRIIKKGK
jgi:transposase-like protein